CGAFLRPDFATLSRNSDRNSTSSSPRNPHASLKNHQQLADFSLIGDMAHNINLRLPRLYLQ
ncbi:hypothetical protein, partial [Pantoea vagans]|uniref:hypothetical protein n=1 Tax=Pantoea vagans TaxID=470934 RepID=UPI00241FF252